MTEKRVMVPFTDEAFDELCARLMEGRSLADVCSDPDMPSETSVFRWLAKDPDGTLNQRYQQATEIRADRLMEEVLHIADDARNDFVQRADGKGKAFDVEHVRRSELRVKTRLWIAERLKPRRYGARMVNEHVGKDGGPIQHQNMTDEELDRRLAELEARRGVE